MRAEFLTEQLKASIVNKYICSRIARVMSDLIDEAEFTIRSWSYLVRSLQNIRWKSHQGRNERPRCFIIVIKSKLDASRRIPRLLNLPRRIAAIDLKNRGRYFYRTCGSLRHLIHDVALTSRPTG